MFTEKQVPVFLGIKDRENGKDGGVLSPEVCDTLPGI